MENLTLVALEDPFPGPQKLFIVTHRLC